MPAHAREHRSRALPITDAQVTALRTRREARAAERPATSRRASRTTDPRADSRRDAWTTQPQAASRREARATEHRTTEHRATSRRDARNRTRRAGSRRRVTLLTLVALGVVMLGDRVLENRDRLITELSAVASSATGSEPAGRGILPSYGARSATSDAATDAATVSASASPSFSPSSSVAGEPSPTPSVTRKVTATAKATAKPTTAAPPKGVEAAVETLTDVAYAEGSAAQRLDLYLPERTGQAVPLVIMIHGGAFSSGDKSNERGEAEALQAKGYAVASVNYRLSGEARFPAGVRDVKASVRWLRANAATYGLHPRQFVAWGHSAGGYLATMLGVTGDRRTTFDDADLGNAKVSGAVQMVVALSGPTDFSSMDADAADPGGCEGGAQVHDAPDSPESVWLGAAVPSVPDLAQTANPMKHLAAARTLPRFVVAHGATDCLVPHGQSDALVAALEKKKAKVSYAVLDGVGHDLPSGTGGLYAPALQALDAVYGGD